ncbi:MAG TPA: flagellar basal body rod C-terminal domain-containing protein, partial [Gemmataceae bacterium]|nr:flagellar basal body rod C-terminal domain-containing protein [Gemmataceae bacterium]
LRILAQPGYTFDFTGGIPSIPDTSGLTGTTVPQLGGSYTGTTNDNYTFSVSGAGTVGVTPNLTLQVKDQSGTVLASLNIGQGYSPGTTLQAANGITVSLSSGTVNAADTFSTPVVGQPDSAGILSALGLGSFFSGSTASNLTVNLSLLSDPQDFAAGLSGQPGDGSNLQRMINLRDTPLLANNTQSLSQFYSAIIGDVGAQVQGLQQLQTTQQATAQQLSTQQQSVSGVDPNEEMVNLLQYQRAFQSASRYISEVNKALDEVFNIVT